MRIISGNLGGRKIEFPRNLPVRPTTDFAKNGLFNILNNHFSFESLSVLDLFCGAGGITMEFISRGCKDIISVDSDIRCVKFLKSVIEKFAIENARVVKSDSLSFIERCTVPFDLVFSDAPFEYPKTSLIPSLIFEKKLLNPKGWLIVEHSKINKFEGTPHFRETREYGDVRFSIFENDI